MKNKFKINLMLLSSLVVLGSCGTGNNSNEEAKDSESKNASSISDVVQGVSNLDNLGDAANKLEEIQKKLKSETPISIDVLKAFLLETWNGLKRTSFSSGTITGIHMANAEATYKTDDQKELKIVITDGAGEAGSAIVGLTQMGLMMDTENISESSVEKTELFAGKRAKTKETKGDDNYPVKRAEISYVEQDRFLIVVDGEGYSLDELKEVINKLDTSLLK